MQVFILLCFVASAFAVRECPENSHYNDCGTFCPVTCANYQNPPQICERICVPGCHCDEGYVERKDGHCVLPEDCDEPVDAVCGPNQEYKECGTPCPLTCDNYNNPPKICPAMCVSGCHCQKGYVKTAEGRCVLPENCPSRAFDKKACLQPEDGGMCRASIPMYYYDAKTGDCKEFIYGGCDGNDNQFGTEEECLEKCGDVRVWDSSSNICEQPIERGTCYAYIPRYAFDKTTGQCKKFIYSGCRGNGNNFRSPQECERACVPSAAPSACEQEKVVGPCKAAVPRYFYNKVTGQCEKFIYGGCSGNSNNFETQEDCEAVCTA